MFSNGNLAAPLQLHTYKLLTFYPQFYSNTLFIKINIWKYRGFYIEEKQASVIPFL